jgi:hypothetical protein
MQNMYVSGKNLILFLMGDRTMSLTTKKLLTAIGYYAILIAAMFMFANQPIFS